MSIFPPIRKVSGLFCLTALLLSEVSSTLQAAPEAATIPAVATSWEACGWGGGGFYYAAAFHPSQDGVIYLAGDVGGAYKSVDNGRTWKMMNTGLVGTGVFSLATDPATPQNLYAASDRGLCKSTDGGDHWELVGQAKELHLSGQKGKSIRCIAVDPTNSANVYAGTPTGKVYKSTDGGQSWTASYEKKGEEEAPSALRGQFGKVNDAFFGGFWVPLSFPNGAKSADCVGFGFTFKGDGSTQARTYLTLKTTSGATYQSKNLNEIFLGTTIQDIILHASDFTLDPGYAKKHPEAPAVIDWSTVNRFDFSCAGDLPATSSLAQFTKFFFAFTQTPDGKTGTEEAPVLVTARDFVSDKAVQSYGNIKFGSASSSSCVFTVAVAPKNPSLVAAATSDTGIVLSEDAGASWTALSTPAKATAVTFDPADPNTLYAGFRTDGISKSSDKGKTWAKLTGLPGDTAILEIVVSPANSNDVYAIGNKGWGGQFYQSHDGGQTWTASGAMTPDRESDPTLPGDGKGDVPLSVATNLAINPLNPKELYISANWRSCLSEDGGQTWAERNRGADISCIADIRFSGDKVYTSAMDEGTFVSETNGKSWQQLWPLRFDDNISGHNWRLGVNNINGVDQIIATISPWNNKHPNKIIVSQDGGKSYKVVTEGLPDYLPKINSMWEHGYPRGLAVDPKNPKVVYLGLDGDAEPGKSGGGVFKSEDGGLSWKQLANQPGSRRMFNGLVIDPTDSQRLYWGCCAKDGGLYRSDNGGDSWTHVFSTEPWIFDVLVTSDGTVYAPGQNVWRSTDHGATWKQVTHLAKEGTIMGLTTDPRNPKSVWFSNSKGIYKTTDGGDSWQNITGDMPFLTPMVLRFNPTTQELWAGWVGLYKTKQ